MRQCQKEEKIIESDFGEFKGLNPFEIKQIMTPKNDYIFKRLFGRIGKENIVKDFLEAVLDVKIKSAILGNETILLPEETNGKTGVLDVRVTLENNTEIDIEIQNSKIDYLVKRMHFYLARLYQSSLKIGSDYSSLRKAIVICITNFDAFENIENYHTIWKMTEVKNINNKFNELEMHFVELPKFLRSKFDIKKKLDQWLLFIDYSKKELIKQIMEENENVREAKENMDEITKDKHEQYLAWLHEKYLLDKNTAIKAGIEKIAKRMLDEKMEISLIAKLTNLTEEEIQALIDE